MTNRLAPLIAILLTSGAACAQQITPNTKCGEAATGYKYGTREALTLDAAAARGVQVGPDGVWRFCQAEPVTVLPAECRFGVDEWQADGNACRAWQTSPRSLAHGRQIMLRTPQGPLTGDAIYACTDGALRLLSATCRPTTHCTDVRYEGVRDGVAYRWGPGTLAVGDSAKATADSGAALTITCTAGVLRGAVDIDRPATQAPTAQPQQPRVVQCGPQEATGWVGWRYLRVRYGGLPVDVGAAVESSGARLICGSDGKLRQDASVIPAPGN